MLGRRCIDIQASSRLTYSYPARAMPLETIASAIPNVRFSSMFGPKWFQLDQPSCGTSPTPKHRRQRTKIPASGRRWQRAATTSIYIALTVVEPRHKVSRQHRYKQEKPRRQRHGRLPLGERADGLRVQRRGDTNSRRNSPAGSMAGSRRFQSQRLRLSPAALQTAGMRCNESASTLHLSLEIQEMAY